MRKFPKAFTRRKSTANAFDEPENGTPTEGSFKVFDRTERAESGSRSFDGGLKLSKPPLSGPGRSTHSAEDNMFDNLGSYRYVERQTGGHLPSVKDGDQGLTYTSASGGSNSNTASTTDNSSRLSAASTTPSSTDIPGRGEDFRSPHDKPFNNIPMPPVPKSSSNFSLKSAGRSLSWGRTKPSTPPAPPTPKESKSGGKELPSLPSAEDSHSTRSRAVTASSYASTATPPRLEDKELGLSLGGDFSDMFAAFGKRKSVVMASDRGMSHSPDNLPTTTARVNRFNSPTHLTIDKNKEVEESPYSWSSQNSHDGLMANRSPPPRDSPSRETPPPVPQHGQIREVRSTARPGATAPDGLRRSSAFMGKRQSTLEYTDAVDEDARLLRESVSASRKLNDPGYHPKVRDSWALPSASTSSNLDDAAISNWRAGSVETTPKPKKADRSIANGEDSMFDSQIAASASLASRFEERTSTPPTRSDPTNKVMTPAQFERYKQDKERLRSIGGKSKEEEDEDDNYDDDEDEAEKVRQAAKQRRKQEAHMAVYRQQMMKVTGEAAAGPRPGMTGSQSTPNLMDLGRDDGEDEDEEIPLAILQAHGFPNKNKPPMRSMGSNPNFRASTMLGGGDGRRLPVFARNLPQDPYYGAGLQRPMHRESMAFGGGSGSVVGGPTRGAPPPGGLVGVIATEERSRAMRRGSPNAQGDYPPVPSMGPPHRASTTGSIYGGMGPGQMGMGPMGPMGPMGVNPMMLTPGDQAQMQLTAQMQQFMQMQMQFMHMMTQGQGAPSVQTGSVYGEGQRPNSSQHLRPGPAPVHQRAMTMVEPNSAPWMQPGYMGAPSIRIQGYTPSIAPSERSNVGMPGRYRPVSHVPLASDNKSRLSTMSGALPNWETQVPTPTIKPVKKSGNASDEDDEEGWEEMAKKREKKKSMWRSKRDTNGFKDLLHLT